MRIQRLRHRLSEKHCVCAAILCATPQFPIHFVKFPTLAPLLHLEHRRKRGRVLSLFRKVKQSGVRAGLAMANGGFALAAIKQRANAKPVVEHLAMHATEGGDTEKTLAAAIGSLQLQRARMSAVIGTEDYQLVQVEAPEVLPSELRTAVRWRLRDVITFHIDDATVDVFE